MKSRKEANALARERRQAAGAAIVTAAREHMAKSGERDFARAAQCVLKKCPKLLAQWLADVEE